MPKSETQPLRTIEIDGEPWFHATDVCKCVGLSTNGGTFHHLRKLDADEKQTLKKSQNRILGADQFLGQTAVASVINESGLSPLHPVLLDRVERLELA